MVFNLGDILHGQIIDFTHEGNGVLKIDSFAFFIPNGIIGDIVEFKVTKLKKNYGLGSIVSFIELSRDRVD
ncbi:MAG: TRAM domain-containing protein, partial [Tissierellia bacterium]|nr:TRAM domain-containing protein [Tissierellia bacterium]